MNGAFWGGIPPHGQSRQALTEANGCHGLCPWGSTFSIIYLITKSPGRQA